MSDPMNELLVFTRQEMLEVFKCWYKCDEDPNWLDKAINGVDFIIHQLNENKPK